MKDAQKPDHVSLSTLIGRLKDGRFVIPDFQREFEWRPWDIRDLMRSIFLDYYIGSLLLWKGKPENFDALSCEPIYGFNDSNGSAEHIVLDGQQRLTAMYYAFVAPDISVPNRANRFLYFIHVRASLWRWRTTTRSGTTGRGDRLKSSGNTTEQYEGHLFPLSVMGQGGWALFDWVQGYESYWRGKAAHGAGLAADAIGAETALRYADDAKDFGEHLRGITEQYQVAYIELDRDLAVDKVCDIFTQVNSKGIRLDVFDLINALLKPKGMQLRHMWREAAPRLDFVETEQMNVYILQVMSILRQAYCSPKYLYYLLPQQEKLVRDPDGSLRKRSSSRTPLISKALWDSAVEALRKCASICCGTRKNSGPFRRLSSVHFNPPRVRRVAAEGGDTSHQTGGSTPSASYGTGIGRVFSRTDIRAPSSRRLPATSSMSRHGLPTTAKNWRCSRSSAAGSGTSSCAGRCDVIRRCTTESSTF